MILECSYWQEQRDPKHDLEMKNNPINLHNIFITFSHTGVVHRTVVLMLHLKNLFKCHSESFLIGPKVFYQFIVAELYLNRP